MGKHIVKLYIFHSFLIAVSLAMSLEKTHGETGFFKENQTMMYIDSKETSNSAKISLNNLQLSSKFTHELTRDEPGNKNDTTSLVPKTKNNSIKRDSSNSKALRVKNKETKKLSTYNLFYNETVGTDKSLGKNTSSVLLNESRKHTTHTKSKHKSIKNKQHKHSITNDKEDLPRAQLNKTAPSGIGLQRALSGNNTYERDINNATNYHKISANHSEEYQIEETDKGTQQADELVTNEPKVHIIQETVSENRVNGTIAKRKMNKRNESTFHDKRYKSKDKSIKPKRKYINTEEKTDSQGELPEAPVKPTTSSINVDSQVSNIDVKSGSEHNVLITNFYRNKTKDINHINEFNSSQDSPYNESKTNEQIGKNKDVNFITEHESDTNLSIVETLPEGIHNVQPRSSLYPYAYVLPPKENSPMLPLFYLMPSELNNNGIQKNYLRSCLKKQTPNVVTMNNNKNIGSHLKSVYFNTVTKKLVTMDCKETDISSSIFGNNLENVFGSKTNTLESSSISEESPDLECVNENESRGESSEEAQRCSAETMKEVEESRSGEPDGSAETMKEGEESRSGEPDGSAETMKEGEESRSGEPDGSAETMKEGEESRSGEPDGSAETMKEVEESRSGEPDGSAETMKEVEESRSGEPDGNPLTDGAPSSHQDGALEYTEPYLDTSETTDIPQDSIVTEIPSTPMENYEETFNTNSTLDSLQSFEETSSKTDIMLKPPDSDPGDYGFDTSTDTKNDIVNENRNSTTLNVLDNVEKSTEKYVPLENVNSHTTHDNDEMVQSVDENKEINIMKDIDNYTDLPDVDKAVLGNIGDTDTNPTNSEENEDNFKNDGNTSVLSNNTEFLSIDLDTSTVLSTPLQAEDENEPNLENYSHAEASEQTAEETYLTYNSTFPPEQNTSNEDKITVQTTSQRRFLEDIDQMENLDDVSTQTPHLTSEQLIRSSDTVATTPSYLGKSFEQSNKLSDYYLPTLSENQTKETTTESVAVSSEDEYTHMDVKTEPTSSVSSEASELRTDTTTSAQCLDNKPDEYTTVTQSPFFSDQFKSSNTGQYSTVEPSPPQKVPEGSSKPEPQAIDNTARDAVVNTSLSSRTGNDKEQVYDSPSKSGPESSSRNEEDAAATRNVTETPSSDKLSVSVLSTSGDLVTECGAARGRGAMAATGQSELGLAGEPETPASDASTPPKDQRHKGVATGSSDKEDVIIIILSPSNVGDVITQEGVIGSNGKYRVIHEGLGGGNVGKVAEGEQQCGVS